MSLKFKGMLNIIRFNWDFYLFALSLVFLCFIKSDLIGLEYKLYFFIIGYIILIVSIFSLAVSFYIYDYSDIYSFNWIKKIYSKQPQSIINIHAGFDNISYLIEGKFEDSKFRVFDFYDPDRIKERSLTRARKVTIPYDETISVDFEKLPAESDSVDLIFLVFSAHEIRDNSEREKFFQEVARITKPDGNIILVEHLRDLPNFLAFTIGFFHFFSEKTWLKNFELANLEIVKEVKHTPFVSIYNLRKVC